MDSILTGSLLVSFINNLISSSCKVVIHSPTGLNLYIIFLHRFNLSVKTQTALRSSTFCQLSSRKWGDITFAYVLTVSHPSEGISPFAFEIADDFGHPFPNSKTEIQKVKRLAKITESAVEKLAWQP